MMDSKEFGTMMAKQAGWSDWLPWNWGRKPKQPVIPGVQAQATREKIVKKILPKKTQKKRTSLLGALGQKQGSAAQEFGTRMAKQANDMPPFTSQDRPEKTKDIYRALKREHPGMPAEMKARIAARQGKKGKQKQGPPYKGKLTKTSNIETVKRYQGEGLSLDQAISRAYPDWTKTQKSKLRGQMTKEALCRIITKITKKVSIPSIHPSDHLTPSTNDMAKSKDVKGARPVG